MLLATPSNLPLEMGGSNKSEDNNKITLSHYPQFVLLYFVYCMVCDIIITLFLNKNYELKIL